MSDLPTHPPAPSGLPPTGLPQASPTDPAAPAAVVRPKPVAFLTAPQRDLAAWVRAFESRPVPVLTDTADVLEQLRAAESAGGDIDAHAIAQMCGDDPLMALKLLRQGAAVARSREDVKAPTSATEALVLMGITPFFRSFGMQPTVEDQLQGHAGATAGFLGVLERSRRAARFAQGFAAQRGDSDAPLLHDAALIHDFAEMLLWLHAPSLALSVEQMRVHFPTQRSGELQQTVLHASLAEIQIGLMKSWRLPEPMLRLLDEEDSTQHKVRNVQLAIRVARHSAHGWDDPALPQDVEDIAELLGLSSGPTEYLLARLDLGDDPVEECTS